MSAALAPRRRFAAMSPRAQSTTWRVVAILVLAGAALLCWHNIAQTLGNPIEIQLSYGEGIRYAAITGGTAHATHTGVVLIGVQLTHVSSQLRWLLALAILNGSVIQAAIVLVFGIIWVRTSGGHPFARTVTRSLTALSVIVLVLGTLQEALSSWVGLREAYEAVGSNVAASPYSDAYGFQITGVWIVVAFGIGVLASAFAIGARLTRDNEGLI
jgi:hypothetical protein